MPRKLLVVDDDPASGRLAKAIFTAEGFAVTVAADGTSGLERAATEDPLVVLLDLHLPDIDGLEVLERLLAAHPATPVVMLTSEIEVKTAVRAMRLGAFDYLTKPVDHEELTLTVARAVETRALRKEVADLRRRVGEDGGLAEQMGSSAVMRRVIDQVTTVAGSAFSVLVLGETGTGKELIARAIHRLSERRDKPFVALDCGAIPENLLESELFGHEKGAFTGADRRKEGRFQIATGGTLFLDEIGNLPTGLQAKLLRVLEAREVQAVGSALTTPLDVRFVAATNDDLQARVAAGAFRADLYFRIAQYTITLPALRARPDDIAHLAQRFLDEAAVELRRPVHEIAAEALELLRGHAWPGNVRELRTVIRRGVLEAKEPVLRAPVLQPFVGESATAARPPVAPGTPRASLREVADTAAREAERHVIVEALREHKGNKTQAARALDTDYKTLHVKMKQLGIRADDFTP
jgi:DNA-binding NtrC family response regulator